MPKVPKKCTALKKPKLVPRKNLDPQYNLNLQYTNKPKHQTTTKSNKPTFKVFIHEYFPIEKDIEKTDRQNNVWIISNPAKYTTQLFKMYIIWLASCP